MLFGNFLASLARGRDSRRKQDMRAVVQALELYYNDIGRYPDDLPAAGDPFTHPDNADSIYLKETPADPKTAIRYCYETADGSSYRLAGNLENTQDPDLSITPVSCGGTDYNYGASSSNVNL